MARFLPVLVTIFIIFMFYVKRLSILKFYPPICNLFFFLVFFLSLFAKETVIQKIAKKIENKWTDNLKVYTRKLTYVWCCFTFINFVISVITIFLSDNVWMLYNGCISYVLMGTLFLGEYILRKNLKRRKLL